ncbi:hypothetical protein CHU98_g7806 [Xylaria longipes]|nr:hypothetical protein CHU98_g7806 [Xylaria longipes]
MDNNTESASHWPRPGMDNNTESASHWPRPGMDNDTESTPHRPQPGMDSCPPPGPHQWGQKMVNAGHLSPASRPGSRTDTGFLTPNPQAYYGNGVIVIGIDFGTNGDGTSAVSLSSFALFATFSLLRASKALLESPASGSSHLPRYRSKKHQRTGEPILGIDLGSTSTRAAIYVGAPLESLHFVQNVSTNQRLPFGDFTSACYPFDDGPAYVGVEPNPDRDSISMKINIGVVST